MSFGSCQDADWTGVPFEMKKGFSECIGEHALVAPDIRGLPVEYVPVRKFQCAFVF
jgi:hypothetical protein